MVLFTLYHVSGIYVAHAVYFVANGEKRHRGHNQYCQQYVHSRPLAMSDISSAPVVETVAV